MSESSDPRPFRYAAELANQIETRWQAYWQEHRTFHADVDHTRPKFYVLDMFIGPSGTMHVGHPLGYVATDVYGRYLRIRGYNVMHAFGFDAFGLPAEQYAIQTGQHPRTTTERTIATIRGQLRRLGFGHDERRSVSTTDVRFYRWTQWMFLQIFNSWYDAAQDKARPIAEPRDPFDKDSEPEPPLARLTDWATVRLDLGDGPKTYRRETHTMPQWAGSCWYELRYLDPRNDRQFCDPAIEKYWMGPRGEADPGGVDLYVGGVEHAVLHLLYARFWHKVLYDLGYVSSKEPFRRLVTIGYIQAYAYTDERGVYVPAAEVEECDGQFFHQGRPVRRSLGKMGKSLRNMVTPDEMCETYGADTFRLYVMSTGPLRVCRPWDARGIVGLHRFLQRVWRTFVDEESGDLRVVDAPAKPETRRQLHRTIAAVGKDMDDLAFNTAIARLIELSKHLSGLDAMPREAAEPYVLMLAPFAPHIAEELWARLQGAERSLAYVPYPEPDPACLVAETVTCVVQVAGKVRDRLEVPREIGEAELQELALASAKVRTALAGLEVAKVVVGAPRLVNVVPR
ncbi:MAG TPA: class I tRNA ligase family protein [Actinopolymorphaceae bacterium]|jgi:leucyl-tRNA synthetase